MPRTARLIVPDLSVHIVQRGHDGNDCFFSDEDYFAYLSLLREFAPRCACSVHAYCLMTNHVHLFLTPHTTAACALLMKNIGQRYVQRINALRKRSGTLWEGRFYSCLVPTERYALACYRYVECNPVKPGMVVHPDEYRWSSYRLNARTPATEFITPHPAYLALGDAPARRAETYRRLCEAPLPPETLQALRKATRGGYAAGTTPRKPGRPRKLGTDPN